ncbi:ABC transporter permease [Pseudonocardia acaciae]|uniref:ABC transporter permease n=1 Tax=Pseudonocardia acaciae TaxID=551276 RepID=UPI0004903189|nr:ABC transporter permease [Pseudonocardia acaciae]
MSLSDYLAQRWPRIVLLFVQHAEVVLIAVGIATVIGVGLGVALEGYPRVNRFVVNLTGSLLTIPSLALFGLLIPLLGLGLGPTITALVVYAIFPILRNTLAGLESVPGAVTDAAMGIGLSGGGRLRLVRLPLAWPVVLTGVRVATIMSVAIAAVAAAVSGPGLGQLIFDGLARLGGANALNEALVGTVAVAVLALALDLMFVVIARLTTSRGLR